MSLVAKTTLGGTIAYCIGMVIYVHRKQTEDKLSMKEGVIKDYERQQMKKLMNVKWLQEQEDLSKVLRAQRKVDMKRKEDEKKQLAEAAT